MVVFYKKEIKFRLDKRLYLSFGENCLTDNILNRHGVKSFTTPFSHGRSNVEYILNLERDGYKDFLNKDFLEYELLDGKQVPRLRKYNIINNTYDSLHMNGFEFTHHDVISNNDFRNKFHKRVEKLRKYVGSKKFVIFYHHRMNCSTNINQLLWNMKDLKNLYSGSKRGLEAVVVLFYQEIVHESSERSLIYNVHDGIHVFKFKTMSTWGGNNEDVLWARLDDDLVKQMVDKAKHLN